MTIFIKYRWNNAVAALFTVYTVVSMMVGCVYAQEFFHARNLRAKDSCTFLSRKNFLTAYEPLIDEDQVTVVIEIPAGTTVKWEVAESGTELVCEKTGSGVRTIDYLPYPANYGMIPQTLLAKDRNGDGDPLDAIVLGPALPRGTVVTVKLLGSMMMTDQNKEDSKLIGVIPHTNFSSLKSIIELDMKFPGVTKILSTWFTNYKGRGQTKIHGFKDAREAHRLLTIAVDEYREKHKKTDADASPDQ